MEWDDLKHFLAVARLGSLTGAARALKAGPATVGRRVAALEGALGTRLFDRAQSGYSLTESGEAIRLHAEEVEDAILSVERATLARDRRASGIVRVAATDDTAVHLIAPHLSEFRSRYPDISLELIVRMDLVNLSRREADIALRGVRPARGDFIIRQFGSWEFGLYAAKSYVVSRRLKPGLTDLSGVDIITWNDEHAQVRGGPWLAEHARGARVALTANSRRIHYAACKAGIGVAILPCQQAEFDLDLICLLPPERVLSVKLWLVASRDILRAARVRAVMDFLAELGARSRKKKPTDRPPRQ